MGINYGQFCPVAIASEVLCSRWTVLVIRELTCGSTRFNQIRRGVPLMSPSLLSKRLSELSGQGVVEVHECEDNMVEYHLSPAGRELMLIIESFGLWGKRWFKGDVNLSKLDAGLLMWDVRRLMKPNHLMVLGCVIEFHFPELANKRQHHWMVVKENNVDYCILDPDQDTDLLIATTVKALTSIHMGYSSIEDELAHRALSIHGNPQLAKTMNQWLCPSLFAAEPQKFPQLTYGR
jgi:DNA-binding HxlR family transcriptional regulator